MDIEDARKKKLAEMEQRFLQQNEHLQNQLQEQIAMQQQVTQLERAAKLWMDREAASRFTNLKVAHPDKAIQVCVLIAEFVQQGKLNKLITDDQMKELLIYLEERKKEQRIQRK